MSPEKIGVEPFTIILETTAGNEVMSTAEVYLGMREKALVFRHMKAQLYRNVSNLVISTY